jgi:DNA-binding CsgD family transcriptional regulator
MLDTNIFAPQNYNRFFNDARCLCEAALALFSPLLLYRISDLFGYDSISLTHYPNRQYAGVESIGKASEIIDYYNREFRWNDPFANHISQNAGQNADVMIFQSSKIFADRYEECTYNRFLNRFGVYWALSVAFGDYRLTLYKCKHEGDFLPIEHDSLELIANIIKEISNKCKLERSYALASKNLAVSLMSDQSFQKAIQTKYPLSNQEARIAILLASGMSYKDIGETTYSSINTVRSHVKNIYRKLDIHNFLALYELIRSV